jgi:hypothetical protein
MQPGIRPSFFKQLSVTTNFNDLTAFDDNQTVSTPKRA